MLNRRRALMAQGGTAENLYLNDILTLDGIKNTRSGHNASSTKWENLAGNSFDFAKTSASGDLLWGDDCLQFDGASRRLYCNSGSILTAYPTITIELVFKPIGTPNGSSGGRYYGHIFQNGSGNMGASKNITISQVDDMGIYVGVNNSVVYRRESGSSGNNVIKYWTIIISPTGAKVYSGSTLVKETTTTWNASDASAYNYMGYNYTTAWYPDGNLYRFGISSGAMTASEMGERRAFFKDRFNF